MSLAPKNGWQSIGVNRRLVNDVYFPTFFAPANWQAYVELPRGRTLPNAFQDLDRSAQITHAHLLIAGRSAQERVPWFERQAFGELIVG